MEKEVNIVDRKKDKGVGRDEISEEVKQVVEKVEQEKKKKQEREKRMEVYMDEVYLFCSFSC